MILPGPGPLAGGVQALGFATAAAPCGPFSSWTKSARDTACFLSQLPALARHIRGLAESFEPDLVLINGPRMLPAAALAHLRTSVVFHSHSLLPPGPVRALCGVALRALDASVVGVCGAVAAQWKPFLAASRMEVVHIGVDGPPRAAAKRPETPLIGCIGRIAPEKRQLDFVEAARRIAKSLPGCRFSITGAPLFGDPAAMRYDLLVREAAAGLPVEFRGWSSDVYGELSEMDLLLVPAAPQEATPRVLLEAFAAGVPVIAFPSAGISEIVHHGHNGFLADSPEAMAALAVQLLSERRERLNWAAHAARETWRNGLTREHSQRRMIEVLTRRARAASTTNVRPIRPGERLR